MALLFSDCDKKPFNYRNDFIGDWTFHYAFYSCCFGPPNPSRSDTADFEGKIYYNRKMKKNEIQIAYAPGHDDLFTVDKNGTLGACGVDGNISGSNIVFVRNFQKECTGALGSGSSYTVTGIKN